VDKFATPIERPKDKNFVKVRKN